MVRFIEWAAGLAVGGLLVGCIDPDTGVGQGSSGGWSSTTGFDDGPVGPLEGAGLDETGVEPPPDRSFFIAERIPMMKQAIVAFGLLASLTCGACNQGGRCEEMSRTLVTDPSEPLLIGGTLTEIRATVGGTRSGPMLWQESESYVRGFPAPGQTEITVTIAGPQSGWELDYEVVDAARNERLTCTDLLETELEIHLQSADGVLDASIVAPVDFDVADTATIVVDLTEEDVGTLQWDPIEEDAELLLWLTYGTLDGPYGSLRLRRVERDDSGQGGVGMTVDLATWVLE